MTLEAVAGKDSYPDEEENTCKDWCVDQKKPWVAQERRCELSVWSDGRN